MLIPREMHESECLQALAASEVGRIVLCTPEGPRAFPVNYALDGGSLVFRTSPYGTIGRDSRSGANAAFQVDHVDPDTKTGWSVLAMGKLEVVEDPHELLSLAKNPQPWAGGYRGLYLRLRWRSISGRCVER